MNQYTPSKVYGSLMRSPRLQKHPHDMDDENIYPLTDVKLIDRQIQVSAIGEVTHPPDRCKLVIKIVSEKNDVEEAKSSVKRRFDYVLQTLHNHSIKESDIKVYKNMRRVDSMYSLETIIEVMFCEVHKCQTVSNILVEKLDETVNVCLPQFSHAQQTLHNLRQQASLLAIHNAKQKAQEMARLVHQAVGRPLSVREEENKEWNGSNETLEDIESVKSVQQRVENATISISRITEFRCTTKNSSEAQKVALKCPPNLYINVKEALYGRNQWDDCQYFVGDCTEVFNVDDQCCGRNDCSLVVRKIYSIKCLAYVSFFRIIYECETDVFIIAGSAVTVAVLLAAIIAAIFLLRKYQWFSTLPITKNEKSGDIRTAEINKNKLFSAASLPVNMTDSSPEKDQNAVSPAYACDETTKEGFIRVIVGIKGLTVSRQFKSMKFIKVPENATIPQPEFTDRSLLLRVEGKAKGALKGKLFILKVRQLPFDINPDKSYFKAEEDRVLLFLSKTQDKSWYPELESGLETAEDEEEEEEEKS
ncbi:Interleukin-1 receptor-associated kinase 1-binding protein 1 [Mytilus edulis]|uniref:Interleukin-1 receptor-associated kinase 1-binding protein 1 n=3 Tax=Mytilus TaxID=6548 RepID=A0A8S3RSQ0_MYTED|nr:Interleukin-1 receptor-associated kinase 1-binding protein 1 [Mytilus edulis]